MKINLTPYTVGKVELLTFLTQKDVQIVKEIDIPAEEVANLMSLTLLELDQVLRNKMKEDNIKGAKEYLDINDK